MVQPVTGFHVASVHSIPEWSATPRSIGLSRLHRARQTGSGPADVSSSRLRSLTSLTVGASFSGWTVTVKVRLAERAPSDTVTVIVPVPLWFDAGVTVTVRVSSLPAKATFASGRSAGLLEAALRTRPLAGVSTSEIVNVSGPAATSSPTV